MTVTMTTSLRVLSVLEGPLFVSLTCLKMQGKVFPQLLCWYVPNSQYIYMVMGIYYIAIVFNLYFSSLLLFQKG